MQQESVPQPSFGVPSQHPHKVAPNQQKVSLNPFPHLKEGVTSLVKNNLSAVLIAVLISSIVSVGLTIAFMYAAYQAPSSLFSGSMTTAGTNSPALVKIIAIFIGVGVLAALITGYFGSVINRIIITGSRGQKEDLGHAFNFVLSRYPKIILTYLLVFAAFMAGGIVISVVGSVAPILGVILVIAAVVVGIVFAFRIAYIPLILVDDENPGRPLDVIRRSSKLWDKSGGALVVYALVCLAIYIIINALIGNGDPSGTSTYDGTSPVFSAQPTAFTFGIGAVLVTSFIVNCFGAMVSSGEASIYNDARGLLDGKHGGPTGATSTPPAHRSSSNAPLPPTLK